METLVLNEIHPNFKKHMRGIEATTTNFSTGFEIISYLPNITKKEINNYRNGNIEFRKLESIEGYILYLVKIGKIKSEILFNPCLYKDDRVVSYINNKGNLAYIQAIDSNNGRLKVLRAIGLTDKIARHLHKDWKVMLQRNIQQKDLVNWYQNLIKRYSTKQLWNFAIQVGKFKSNK
ncbi:hypothetical protein [Dethiothermospora halolimnae]|uniref:hypothetical protein n=1 Tax=Dethiothermospora halolimnae TaxID=3114390 RepID=UPI003CCB843F